MDRNEAMDVLDAHGVILPTNGQYDKAADGVLAAYERGREEQAKRIAELEAALREILKEWPRPHAMREIAREALEAKP